MIYRNPYTVSIENEVSFLSCELVYLQNLYIFSIESVQEIINLSRLDSIYYGLGGFSWLKCQSL